MGLRSSQPVADQVASVFADLERRVQQLEQRPFVPAAGPGAANPVWVPSELKQVVRETGKLVAVAETTVAFSTVAGLVVPPSALAVLYLTEVTITAGAASGVFLAVKHKPGGTNTIPNNSTLQTNVSSSFLQGTTDINGGRCTYQTTIFAGPTYTYTIYVAGFWCQP